MPEDVGLRSNRLQHHKRLTARASIAGGASAVSVAKVFFETVDLVHARMQDRDDADIAIGQSAPIDDVMFVPAKRIL